MQGTTVVRARGLVAALVAACAVLPAAVGPARAASSEDLRTTRDAWNETRDEIDEVSSTLEHVDTEVATAVVALDEIRGQVRTSVRELEALREELTAAVERQRIAEQRKNEALVELGQATRVMLATEDSLEAQLEQLRQTVVVAYKHASGTARMAGMFDALERSGSVTEFLTAHDKLQTSAEVKDGLVSDVRTLADRLARDQARVAVLSRARAAAEKAATETRRHLADLTRRQSALVTTLKDQRERQQVLVRDLEAKQDELASRLEELEVQSDALTAELAKYEFVGGAPGTGELVWPTDGRLTSVFGFRFHPILKIRRLHAGIDIPAPTGQEVLSAADGTVLSAGVRGGYGNVVVVGHSGGLTTVYAHLSKISVGVGDEVGAADVVGAIGTTGLSTGPHLHFEVRIDGVPADPMQWFE